MNLSKLSLAVGATVALAGVALASDSPVGTWNGHITVDKTKLDAKHAQMVQGLEKMKIVLALKADHTYVINITPAPSNQPADQGVWSVKGSKLSMKSAKGKLQDYVIAKNGKSLTYTFPAKSGVNGSVVYTH